MALVRRAMLVCGLGTLPAAWACAGGVTEDHDWTFGSAGAPTSASGGTDDGGSSDEVGGDAGSEGGVTGGSESGVPLAICGDGVAEGDEACDGDDLRGLTCGVWSEQERPDGTLVCADDCTVLDACYRCGDGSRQDAEVCDGDAFGGATCRTFGFASGTLSCLDCAEIGTDGCEAGAACGDGTRDLGEQCDGADLGGQTCASVGFASGTLACTRACILDTSACMEAGGDDPLCNGQGQGCIPTVAPCCDGLECYGICLPR